MKRIVFSIFIIVTLLGLSTGSAQAQPVNPKALQVSNVTLPPGYFIAPLAMGLDFPTALATSRDMVWVSEAGAFPGFLPKVKQIDLNGNVTTILSADQLPSGMLEGPLTDVTFHEGWLWLTHRQLGVNGWFVGAISKFDLADPVGTFTTVITNLPSAGDHSTEEIIFDANGQAYFSQGSATNSSVVGADNWFATGWLQQAPTFHDFTPKDITLNGVSFQTVVPFPLDPNASMITSPFMPFGSGAVPAGTVVNAATPASPQEGMIAGNATVYSFDPTATDPTSTLHLEGWGFRNPYGIGIDPFNPDQLFTSNNGADYRSMEVNGELMVIESRPIGGDADDMYVVNIGGDEEFFGWPDFFHDDTGAVLPVTDPSFCQEEIPFPCPPFVLDETFRNSLTVQPAFAQLEEHSSANKFDFSTSKKFKFVGDIFIAETGSLPPVTGADEFTGYSVVRINRESGETSDFIVHTANEPDVIFQPDGFNKPIDVKFFRNAMLVADFGVFEPGLNLMEPGSGKVWVVCHGESRCRNLAGDDDDDEDDDDNGARRLSTELTGAAEAPGPGDPDGSGTATIRLRPTRSEVCFEITVSDIALPAIAAHIHVAPVGEPGLVVVPLTPPDASGTSSGCVSDVDPALIRNITQNPEQYYVNVHNAEFPDGAVRGQLRRAGGGDDDGEDDD